jgi:hypothetical protein
MAKANFVKSAQKNVYKIGKRVEYKSEKGKRIGQMLSKQDRTIPADENDEIFIAKGESYFWWQFLRSPKQYSKERPKNSQLTQSSFLSTLYGIEERIEEFSAENKDDFDSFIEEIKSEIEELRDTTQESLDNMPEGLQQGDTGQLLQERVDGLDSWIDEIDGIELDCDEEEVRAGIIEDDEEKELSEDEVEEKVAEEIQEKVNEAISEFQGTSHNL